MKNRKQLASANYKPRRGRPQKGYIKKFIYILGFIFILSLLFFHCGKTEEDLLLESVDEIGDFAEDRDIDGVLSYISNNYSDDEERTFEDIEELLREYFGKFRGIVVNVLATKIIKVEVPNAEIETELALSSGAAKLFRKAVRYSGQFYRFTINLVKEGEKWRCKKALWEEMTLQELFPESTKLLRKLFPNLF